MIVVGADGGNNNFFIGGEGSSATATFAVTSGEVLEIVVGLTGESGGEGNAGGGGGSGIRRVSDSEILMIAGGGGGAGTALFGRGADSNILDNNTFAGGGDNAIDASDGQSAFGGAGGIVIRKKEEIFV